MKKIITTLMLLGLLLPLQAQADGLNYQVINLSAQATEQVPRDLMQASLIVEYTGKNRQAISNEVSTRSNKVLQYLRSNKELTTELTTRSAYPYYLDGSQDKQMWRDKAVITVKSRNFQELSNALAKVQADAAIRELNFIVSDSKKRQLQNKLIDSAIQAFRTKAQIIANSFGKKDYKIVEINIGEVENYGRVRNMMMAESSSYMGKSAGVTIDTEPGAENINLNISGRIQLQ